MRATVVRVSTVVFLIAAGMGSLVGRAQPKTEPDTLGALMVEVRGLRAAIEQMASAGPRIQLGLGRVQLQEQRIADLIRRLDAATTNLAAEKRALAPVAERVNRMKDSMDESDPELVSAKAEWARMNAEVQRLTNLEIVLAQDLASEQSRWTDLNQRLEELERALRR